MTARTASGWKRGGARAVNDKVNRLLRRGARAGIFAAPCPRPIPVPASLQAAAPRGGPARVAAGRRLIFCILT